MSSSKAGTWPAGVHMAMETQLVHAGVSPDEKTGAILTPIYQTTAFVHESVDQYLAKGFTYSRDANPTVSALEAKIAALEGGAAACCMSTGMAAVVTLMATVLKAGDHCVITERSYGGTYHAAREVLSRLGMTYTFANFRDPAHVEAAIQPNTKLIYSETPANPTLALTDLDAVSAIAKARGLLHACDSTFATPIMLRPLEHGCDFVVQSLTKYYDGHNQTVGGAVVSATRELHEEVFACRIVLGNILSPQCAFYILQATKTLGLRFRKQCATALEIADFLEVHPKVETVGYPGLPSFPQKALADKLHSGGVHGAMLWFEVTGGMEAGRRLMDTVQRPWSLCESLGATESIITCPSVMTHAQMPQEDRLKVGISDGFVRVSCGIEDSGDLIRALGTALDNL